jgi:hypothetical protein
VARTGDLQGGMGRDTNFPSVVRGGGLEGGTRAEYVNEVPLNISTAGQSLSVQELFDTATFLEWEKEPSL